MSERDRRRFLQELAGALWISGTVAAAQGSAIQCSVVDAESRRPVSARLRLTDSTGREIVPIGHPAELASDAQQGDVRFQSKRFSYVDGNFSVDPSALPLRYQVIKGYEFVIAEARLPRTISKTIPSRFRSRAGPRLQEKAGTAAISISITFRRAPAIWKWTPRT